jgi:hypothetical protein
MKRLVWLSLLLGFVASDVVWAKPPPPRQHGSHRAIVALAHMSYQPSPPRHGRKAQARTGAHGKPAASTPAATSSPASRERTLALLEAPGGAPRHPGWFKTPDEAGWGFSQGRTETMVGLYKRPEQPDLPGPQIYHQEGRGAAGLAVSLKLGR